MPWRESPKIGSLHVLVVEDNAINQRVLTMQLERAGHRVYLAASGREALEALEQQPIDLVLMDVQLPEMDGVRTTRLLRAREKVTGRRVAVVALTADNLPGERQRCLTAGMDDYLTKPIRAAELHAAIARITSPARNDESTSGARTMTAASATEGDWQETAQGLGFSQTSIVRLARTFLEEVPGRMERLREALAAGNAPAVRAVAHSLKGMLTVFAARAAAEAAGSLEEQGQREQLEDAAGPLAVLESEVRTLMNDITTILPKNST